MAFGDFTLQDVSTRFDLTIDESGDLFATTPEMAPGDRLESFLADNGPLARALNTEKARSEFLIAPILAEVRIRLDRRVGLFSGVEFSPAPEHGLNGVCDFLFSASNEQFFVRAPVLVIVEAKNENIKGGLGPCVAAMIGARLFNERQSYDRRAIHGAVTTGTLWQFLTLEANVLRIDIKEYYVENVAKILGIVAAMLSDDLDRTRLVA